MADDKPIFRNTRVLIFGEITVDSGSKAVFKPYMERSGGGIGWQADMNSGETHYIYIAPITANPPGSDPTFFLFVGPHGDPDLDRRLGPYNLKGDQ